MGFADSFPEEVPEHLTLPRAASADNPRIVPCILGKKLFETLQLLAVEIERYDFEPPLLTHGDAQKCHAATLGRVPAISEVY